MAEVSAGSIKGFQMDKYVKESQERVKVSMEEYNITKFEEWQKREKNNRLKTSLRCRWFFLNLKTGIKGSPSRKNGSMQ